MQKATFLYLLVALFLIGCSNEKPTYEEAVADALSSGKINNDIFLGIQLGMTNIEFFDRCTELNKQKVIGEGGDTGLAITHNMTELKSKATMNFYPEFTEDLKVWQMRARIQYDAWAPWNKKLWADSLIQDVHRNFMEPNYGKTGYFWADVPGEGRSICKVEGNRQVTIKKMPDDARVEIRVTDLPIMLEMYKKALAEQAAGQ